MNLGDKVHVVLEVTGEIVGRTYEQDPKVDLKLPWGMLNGLPISLLTQVEPGPTDETAEKAEKAPSNVTQIRQAVQKRRKVIRAAG
jgi:hypothetical protein